MNQVNDNAVSEVSKILRRARELIHRPELWCQGVSSRGAGKTMARCASRAIRDAVGPADPALRWAADCALARAAGVDILVLWNDAWQRSHGEIIAVFDRAIETEENRSSIGLPPEMLRHAVATVTG